VHLFFGFLEWECTDMFAAARTGVKKVRVLEKIAILPVTIIFVDYLLFIPNICLRTGF
jgi:hypothetical protein